MVFKGRLNRVSLLIGQLCIGYFTKNKPTFFQNKKIATATIHFLKFQAQAEGIFVNRSIMYIFFMCHSFFLLDLRVVNIPQIQVTMASFGFLV
jgi:hypothetical protein